MERTKRYSHNVAIASVSVSVCVNIIIIINSDLAISWSAKVAKSYCDP